MYRQTRRNVIRIILARVDQSVGAPNLFVAGHESALEMDFVHLSLAFTSVRPQLTVKGKCMNSLIMEAPRASCMLRYVTCHFYAPDLSSVLQHNFLARSLLLLESPH